MKPTYDRQSGIFVAEASDLPATKSFGFSSHLVVEGVPCTLLRKEYDREDELVFADYRTPKGNTLRVFND